MDYTSLKITADALQSKAGLSTPANQSESGWWLQIATAAEAMAGASTTANPTVTGYMLRAAKAFEVVSGGSGAEENQSYEGFLERIADALELNTLLSPTGNLANRIRASALVFSPSALSLLFSTASVLDSRITFTRASTATMYDATGKLTYAPNNLVTNSTPAGWALINGGTRSIAGDVAVITGNGTNFSGVQHSTASTVGTFYISSVDVAAGSSPCVGVLVDNGNLNFWYTPSTNTFNSVPGAVTVSSEVLTGGFTRIHIRYAATGANHASIWIYPAANNATIVGSGTISVRYPQIEAVTYQTTGRTYNATTASAFHGARLDHNPAAMTVVTPTELVTNGTFDTNTTGWSIYIAGTGVSTNSEAVVTSAGAANGLNQFITTVVGRRYRITVSALAAATNTVARSARIDINESAGGLAYVTVNGTRETLTLDHVATTTSTRLTLQCASSFAWGLSGEFATFDNVSVKLLDAAPLGLLIEEARTNLLTYSAQFDDVAWAKVGTATVTANTETSPEGTTTTDTVNFPAGSDWVYRTFSGAASTAYTFSVWLSGTGTTDIGIYDSVTGGNNRAQITLTATPTRYTYTGTTGAASADFRAYIGRAFGASTATAVKVWGAQLEAGAFATSYIPTVAATVTRAADNASMNYANLRAIYNDSEGTWVVEGDSAQAATGGLFMGIPLAPSAYLGPTQAAYFPSVGANANFVPTYPTANARTKLAFAYKANDAALSANGAVATTDATLAVETLNAAAVLQIGAGNSSSFYINGHIKSLTYFKTRKTNAELVTLST